MPEASLPPETAALYGLPLDEFTPARNQLVKDLKAAKRKEEAAAVGRLRKPPATAWALNQLARSSPQLVEDVVAAAGELKTAMDQAISGDRSALAGTQAAERRTVNAGVEAAAAILTEAGNAAPDSARRKLAESLRAAPLDPAALELLRNGVLTDDVSSTGLGFDLAAAPAPRPVAAAGHPSRPALAAVPDPGPTEEETDVPVAPAGVAERPNKSAAGEHQAEPAGPESAAPGVGQLDAPDGEPPAPPPPSAVEAKADELSRRRLAKKRQELQGELTVLRQRAARLAEQVTDAEAGLVELRKRAAKAADAVADTEAELAELPPPPED